MKEFAKALVHIKQSEFRSAEEILLQITTKEPHNFDANHMLGVVCGKLNKFEQADKFFKTSISIDPCFPPLYRNYGLFLSNINQFHKAIEQFDIAIHLFPNFVPVYNDRGNALEKLHKLDEAIADYDRAIALAPGHFRFYNNRGNALLRKKRFPEALSDFERAIELNENFADAWLGRGNVLYGLRRLDEALAVYDKAIALRPDLAEAWHSRGNVFYNLKRYEEALGAYDKAIALRPDLAETWHKRGIIKVIRGNEQEGQKDCEQAVLLGASKEAVDFNLARHGVIKNVHIVPRKVVEDLFDDHASYFDFHLVNELEYLVPSKLVGLIFQHAGKNTLIDALDLGCGTGLMGVQIRPIVRTLVGVDLSRQMLERAKVRGIYDELACGEIAEFTKSDTRSYDLVTSTDVFIYLGDLSAVFDSVSRRLRVGGYFAFSVETTDEGNYVLQESGRYKHSKTYLEQLGHDSSFKIHAIEDCVIRKEDQRGVPGFLALMSRLRY